jgi:uncharacterized membrane protein YeaQ/YmgE (transglycosylase-associated protein family)
MDFSAHSILWTLLIGLVVGAIAKLLMPGKDPGGCIITILLGIAGAFVGTWIGRIFAGGNYVAGWIMSIVGAMILLLLYRLILRRRFAMPPTTRPTGFGYSCDEWRRSTVIRATASRTCHALPGLVA